MASSGLTSCTKQNSVLSRLVVNLILKLFKLFCHCWNSCVLSVHVCFGEPTAYTYKEAAARKLAMWFPSCFFLFLTLFAVCFCHTWYVCIVWYSVSVWKVPFLDVIFFCLSSRVKLICPELVTDLCLERSGVLLRGASALQFYETQACYFKACLCKYNFMKQFAPREQNNWGIIKLLKTEKCLNCAPLLLVHTFIPVCVSRKEW